MFCSKPAAQLKHVQSLESRAAQLNDRAADINETGIMICNAAAGAPNVMLVNDNWVQLTGIASETACAMSLWQIFKLEGVQSLCILSSPRIITSSQGYGKIISHGKGQWSVMAMDSPSVAANNTPNGSIACKSQKRSECWEKKSYRGSRKGHFTWSKTMFLDAFRHYKRLAITCR